MPRFFLFLVLMVPLSVAALWAINHPGHITITWFDYEIRMAVVLALFLLVVLLVVGSWLTLLIWQIFSWPGRRRYKRQLQKTERGMEALSRAITALAMQDVRAAEKSLKQAIHHLPETALPRLIASQLAQAQGDAKSSGEHLRHLLGYKETAHFATRRLIEQKLKSGDEKEALRLALEADHAHPRDPWISRSLIDLYLRAGRYRDILQRTEGWKIGSPLGEAERRRYAAIGHYFLAQEAADAQAVYRELRHATHYAPDFVPATLAMLEHLQNSGQNRRALHLLKDSWNAVPPAALVEKARAMITQVPPARRARLARRITANAKHAAESAYLRAKIAADLEQYQEAANILREAIKTHDRKLLYALMAEIAPHLGEENEATVWLTRAMDAPNEPHWHCRACGASQRAWELHCHACGALDQSLWQQPELTKTELQPR